jgi:Cu+-exporting ATPase
MAEQGVTLAPPVDAVLTALDARGETPLIVAADGRVVGVIGARDAVRPEAADVIHDLRRLRITGLAILTGDRASAAAAVAQRTRVETVEAELLPDGKARWIAERQAAGRKVAMVGDGINDAPALATAHAGIALGGIGADLAAEAGDLVILGEPLAVLPDLVRLSRATVRVIRQNIVVFAFGLNAVAMASASLGVLGPVPAAVLHQAGSLLVLLNAMRLLTHGDWAELPPVRAVRRLGEAIERLDDRLDLGDLTDRLARQRRVAAVAALGAAVIGYACWGWTVIRPEEVGLVLRQGRYVGALGPGLHCRRPPPFETVTRLTPAKVRSLEIGFRSEAGSARGAQRWESSHARGAVARAEDEGLVITGDGQLAEVTATAHYRLDAARPDAWRAFAFGVAGGDAALRPLAEAAVREVVGRLALEGLLTRGRPEAEARAARLLQERVDAYGIGVVITAVSFQDVHPPLGVVDAYRDVSRAESDRRRRVNEGETYRAEALAGARGRASETVNRAEARRAVAVARASGEADAFVYQTEARATAPALTDLRLYWESVASALAGKAKLVLDSDGAHPRHLVVPGAAANATPPFLNAVLPGKP